MYFQGETSSISFVRAEYCGVYVHIPFYFDTQPPALSSLISVYTPGWSSRGNMRVKCLAQERNVMSRPGLTALHIQYMIVFTTFFCIQVH